MLIGSRKAAVLRWHVVRSFNVAQVLAFGIEHLISRRGSGVEMALAIDAQPVGSADESVIGLLLEVIFAEILAILQSSIGLHVVGEQVGAIPIVDVENLLVRTERDAVGPIDVVGHPDDFLAVGSDVVDRLRQITGLFFGSDLIAIGEIDAT